MRTWIKFCATTSVEDALASIEAGADALGFVFAPSKRQVTPEKAKAIAAYVPAGIERVGVFQNESADRIRAIVEQVGLTAVQLHGEESPEVVSGLFARWTRKPHVGIIRTIIVKDDFAQRFAETCQNGECIDCVLLDSGAGSGKAFDWDHVSKVMAGYQGRFIVAGGLNPQNVGEVVKKFKPWGVDVVSGVEREPGHKDPKKLREFVAAVREAERL